VTDAPLLPRAARIARRDGVLIALLIVAIALRVVLALRGHPFRHTDEVFQSLEQAHRIVFGYGIPVWEFQRHTRWMGLPLLLTLPQYLAAWLGQGPAFYVAVTRIGFGLLSVLPVPLLYLALLRRTTPLIAALACLFALFWYENLDFATSTLSDAVSAPLLCMTALLPLAFTRRGALWAAAFTGLAAITLVQRIQLAPALVVIVGAALAFASVRERHLIVRAAALWMVALSVLDVLAGQYPFEHTVENVRANLIEGVAARYGVLPWFYFPLSIAVHWQAALLVPVPLLFPTWRSHWRLSLPALVLLVALSWVGHKEYRFYFPATMLITAAMGFAIVDAARWLQRWRGAVPALAVLAPVAATALVLPQVTTTLRLQEANIATAEEIVGQWPQTCGVANTLPHDIFVSGGYTYLHRKVPFVYLQPYEIAGNASRFNALLMPADQATPGGSYQQNGCVRGFGSTPICVWLRPGPCSP
jgi:hypothetical protein